MTCRFSRGTTRTAAAISRALPPLDAVERRRRAGGARRRAGSVHRRSTLARLTRLFVPILCQNAPHEVQRRDGRAPRGPSRGRRATRTAARGSPSGALRVQEDEPDRLLAVPPPGPATPVTATADVGAERSPRARCHRGRRLGRDGAVLGEQLAPARRAPAALTSSAYATTPPTKTSLEPGTDVSRAATRPPVHDSAVASVQPAGAAELEHVLLDRPLVAREQVLLDRLASAALELVGPRLGARLDEQVDVDLEVARADRRLDAVAVAARLGERPRHRRLARAVEPEHAAPGRPHPREHALHRLGRERVRPQPLQLARRARAARPRRSRRCRGRRPGAVPARPIENAPSGSVACFVTPCCEVRVRPPHPLGEAARDRLDLALERSRRRRARGRRPRASSSIVRSSCVGPSPPETSSRSASRALGERLRQLLDSVADDRDPRRLEPEPHELARRGTGPFRSLRSPRTSSLPVTTIAARGAAVKPTRRVPKTPRAVTTTCAGLWRFPSFE